MTKKTVTDLGALADYAARAWQREFRSINAPFATLPDVLQTSEMAERYRENAVLSRKRAAQIRAFVRERDFMRLFDLMAAENFFCALHLRVLERAFPLMTESERGAWLQYVWCRSKSRIAPTLALRLFHAVPSLRATVPTSWPEEVRVYRGAWRHSSWSAPYERAKRSVQNGVSWTTDRDTALRFASGVKESAGCVGTATVSRSAILAYFHDPEYLEIDGVSYPCDGYREQECIIDPATIETMSYDRVEPDAD